MLYACGAAELLLSDGVALAKLRWSGRSSGRGGLPPTDYAHMTIKVG